MNLLPEGYQDFFLMDILRLKKPEILALGHIEYHEALNYALTTYRIRGMMGEEQKTPGETIHYDQPKGYDHDPKFYSKVT